MTVALGEVYEGRYRVVEALSQGGFGQTFVAQDEGPGERVVLKTLRLDRAEDWKSIELFEREAKMLERLDHPGIPAYLDWFEVGDEAWCLVQRLAPGETLADRVASGWSPTEDEVIALAKSALEVLVYLQERHPPIVHRDVKPENLLVDDAGRVSLVDFGSVKASATGGRGSTVAGTFGYMAPEQLRGVATERTDLFGLGTTLLHVMTGEQPEDLPTSRLKIDTSEAIPRAPGWLRAWFDRMIDPIEEERFADAREALAKLEAREEQPREAPAVPASGGNDEPVRDTPLPARGEVHEELDRLRDRRRGRLFGWFALVLVGVLVHAFGVSGDGNNVAMLAGFGAMGMGWLGSIWSWAKLRRVRAQDRVEKETGRKLAVDEGAWNPLEVVEATEGGALRLRKRPSVFGSGALATLAAFLMWLNALTVLDRGVVYTLDAMIEMLTTPAFWVIVMMPLFLIFIVGKLRRPTFGIDAQGTSWAKGLSLKRDEIASWRVATRPEQYGSGDPYGRHVTLYARKKDEPARERELFSVHEPSEEAAQASARLLHELVEERLGPSGGRDASSEATGVVLGLDEEGAAVEEASKVEVGAKG